MDDHEHPEVRRERRRAEAIAARGTPERQAQIAELEAAKAAQAAKKRSKPKSGSGRKTPENSTEMFGYPWPEWFALRDAARAHLDATARAQGTTTYGETWKAIEEAVGRELPNQHLTLPKLLEYVTEDAGTEPSMLPTSLIVSAGADADGPEVGFFRLAVARGEVDAADLPAKGEDWTMSDAQRTFWTECVTAMHALHQDAPA